MAAKRTMGAGLHQRGRKAEGVMQKVVAMLFVLATVCGGMSIALGNTAAQGTTKKPADTKKETPPKKDEVKKDDAKNDAKKEEVKEEAPLTKAEFDTVMEEMKTAWNKLKLNAKKKMGEKAAENADEIVKAAEKLHRYDGEVLKGDNKGKKAREQKDWQDWSAALKKNAEEFAKHARKSEWDKADKSRDAINKTCGDCHDIYEPET